MKIEKKKTSLGLQQKIETARVASQDIEQKALKGNKILWGLAEEKCFISKISSVPRSLMVVPLEG